MKQLSEMLLSLLLIVGSLRAIEKVEMMVHCTYVCMYVCISIDLYTHHDCIYHMHVCIHVCTNE